MAASSAMEVDEPEEFYIPDDFEGAAQREGTLDRTEHTCQVCSEKYLQWSFMAYVKASTKAFAVVLDTTLSQARQYVEGEFGNLAVEGRVVMACVFCCEVKHRKRYTTATADGTGFKITSAFKDAARRTKPKMKTQTAKLNLAMKNMQNRMNKGKEAGTEIDIRTVFDAIEPGAYTMMTAPTTYAWLDTGAAV